jgi:hypothetical protein
LLFDPGNKGDMFPRKLNWLATDYKKTAFFMTTGVRTSDPFASSCDGGSRITPNVHYVIRDYTVSQTTSKTASFVVTSLRVPNVTKYGLFV